ncbi:MAG TPA: hypothetical protein VFB46_05170 [Gemmatimonadaceae bacterium]|nr:hypothetical protein [Gemmatimonadaceae bacterium]
MSERIAPPCPHDVGPGIPVCLRCRKEKLVESRERRRRALYATAAVALGVATIGAAGAAGMLDSELRAAGLAIAAQTTRTAPQPALDESVQSTPAVEISSDTALVTPASVTTPPAVELAATIGEGRTPLRGGIYAERRGDDVTVHFDTPLTRTRRPEKFEGLLRETLPLIYGALVDSAIAVIPVGSLVPAQGLTTELPTQGLYVPVAGGRTLRVWPETRPGEDGPLVVRYRVAIAP